MLGGLARRVGYVETVKKDGRPVLVVDSGDLLFDGRVKEDSKKDFAKADFISRAYRHMGAAAVNVGDMDLICGLDFLRKAAAQGMPFISANLLDRSSQSPVFPASVIREVAGVRVAFFGLLSTLPFAGAAGLGDRVLVKDPPEAARETLQKLQGKADLFILLSDLGLQRDRDLAMAVPGIDFIWGGHEGRY
ncbi:MAG: hypothetical protein NTY64_21210, partial [Deltaproteobacteria bacterium]|nr:hypothetical protein [Deltaproteobacteria bacterium]